MEMSFTSESF